MQAIEAINLSEKKNDTTPPLFLTSEQVTLIQERLAAAVGKAVAAESNYTPQQKAALTKGLLLRINPDSSHIRAAIDVTSLGVNASVLAGILEKHLASDPLLAPLVNQPDGVEKEQIKADLSALRAAGVNIPKAYDAFFKRDDTPTRGLRINHASEQTALSLSGWNDALTNEKETAFTSLVSGEHAESFKTRLADKLIAKLQSTGKLVEGKEAEIRKSVQKLAVDIGKYSEITLRSPEQVAHNEAVKSGKTDQVDIAALLVSNPLSALAESDIQKVVAATVYETLKASPPITLANKETITPEELFAEIAGTTDMERELHDQFAVARTTHSAQAPIMDRILAHDLFSEAQKSLANQEAEKNHQQRTPEKSSLGVRTNFNEETGKNTLHITLSFENNAQRNAILQALIDGKAAHVCGANCPEHAAAPAADNDNTPTNSIAAPAAAQTITPTVKAIG
jgi:hypothetical protein